jgi:hypothetical protein
VLPWLIAVMALGAAAVVMLTDKDPAPPASAPAAGPVPGGTSVDAATGPAPTDAATPPVAAPSDARQATIDPRPTRPRAKPDARPEDPSDAVEEPFATPRPAPHDDDDILLKPPSRSDEAAKPEGLAELESDPPGADVFLNGSRIGRTPMRTSLPVGTYTIEMRMKGFKTTETDVEIRTDKLTIIHSVMSAEPF